MENHPLKKTRQWSILLVNDHGKVISFSRFKETVIISVSMLFVAIIAAVILFSLYKNTLNNNTKLKDILSASQKKVSALRNEKDILMARLVISESKVNANSAKKQEIRPKKPLDDNSEKKPSAEKSSTVEYAKKDDQFPEEQQDENSALTINNEDEKPAIVSVNNFNVYYDKDKNILSVQYIIKKTPLSTKIAGYTAVILKNNEVNQNEWLTLPPDNLIEGKPSGKAGQAFLISNFRKIKFKVTEPTNPNRFKKATVFVFSKKGELLLEKDFPILIKDLS